MGRLVVEDELDVTAVSDLDIGRAKGQRVLQIERRDPNRITDLLSAQQCRGLIQFANRWRLALGSASRTGRCSGKKRLDGIEPALFRAAQPRALVALKYQPTILVNQVKLYAHH